MPLLSTAARQIGRAALVLAGILAFPTDAAAQSAGDIAIHGYLTQGWGATSGPQFYGIGKEGTTDLRTAAQKSAEAINALIAGSRDVARRTGDLLGGLVGAIEGTTALA